MSREFGSPGAPESRIEKMSIPDEEVNGWMNTLSEGGFTMEEIEAILAHLNETYRNFRTEQIKKGIGEEVEREMAKYEDYIRGTYGRELTDDQKEYFRAGIEKRIVERKLYNHK